MNVDVSYDYYKNIYNNFPMQSYLIKKENDNYYLLEANRHVYESVDDPKQLDLLIGKEIGHLYGSGPNSIIFHDIARVFYSNQACIRKYWYTDIFTGEKLYLKTVYFKISSDVLIMISENITENREYLKELEKSKIKIEKLYQQSNEAQKIAHLGHWTLKHSTMELKWSDEVYRIFEVRRDEFKPNYTLFLNSIHKEDRAKVDSAFTVSLENQTPYDVTHRLIVATGNIKYVRERGWTQYSPDGKPVTTVGTIHDITSEIVSGKKIRKKSEELKDALLGTINALSKSIELRDSYTAGHQERVASISVAVANELGLDPFTIEGIQLGASVHDIGKLAVPLDLLVKSSKLSPLEFKLIQEHTVSGVSILENIKFPWPILEIVSQHHERIDGSGYPAGLKGKAICLEARIVAVADVFEAMSSHRPYRPALGVENALSELKRKSEIFYDQEIVEALYRVIKEKNILF